MKAGALVSSRPFTVSWSMVDCRPMGHGGTFNGSVRLTVIPENEGYSAMVVPSGLKVTAQDSTAVWSKPFAVNLAE